LQYQHAVIIPSHLLVPEADCTQWSFNSFSGNCGTIFTTNFGIEIIDKNQTMISKNVLAIYVLMEQPIPFRSSTCFRV
jgi:hypothetical protein